MAREITKLHPDLQKKIKQLQQECLIKGLKIGIGECLRTVSEQDALYAQGRTTPGSKITNAKGSTYSSMHQWGIAFDFFLVDTDVDGDGKTTDDTFNNSTGLFDKVGAIGKSIGLEWGGDWKSPVDKPHFQLPDWGSSATKIKAAYGTPEKFFKTWKTPVKTVTSGSTKDNIMWLQEKLNRYGGAKLAVDGSFGPKTQKAVLAYWKVLDWNKAGKDDGTRAGSKTIKALTSGRTK